VPALRPAPVAIHDDGNVPREPLGVQLFQELCFVAGRRFQQVSALRLGSNRR